MREMTCYTRKIDAGAWDNWWTCEVIAIDATDSLEEIMISEGISGSIGVGHGGGKSNDRTWRPEEVLGKFQVGSPYIGG